MRFKSYLIVLIIFGLLLAASVQSLRSRLLNVHLGGETHSKSASELLGQDVRTPTLEERASVSATASARTQSGSPKGLPTASSLTPTHAYKGIEGLAFRLHSPLLFDIPHVQGLAATERSLYISAVDHQERSAFLYEARRDTFAIVQVRILRRGNRYHLGGLHMGSELLWAPLAGDEGDGHSFVLGLDPRYLTEQRSFEVAGRIVAVAEGAAGRLYGIDAKGAFFYEWDAEGREVRKVPNPSGVAYQDLEVVNGSLVCAGADGTIGVLDVLHPADFTVLRRHYVDALSPAGNPLTRKGFTFAKGEFYFLPDDGPDPMLLIYVLADARLEELIPGPTQ